MNEFKKRMEIKKVAGDLIDAKVRIYMEATGEKDYSKSVRVILDVNPGLEKAYLEGE